MAAQRSIEVKVGLLILVSFGILTTFVIIMGGLNLEKTYALYVDFDNPGGLQSGAPVKIAGVKVGNVQSMEFRGGQVDAQTGRRSLVRAKLSMHTRVKESVHQNADFYVTTQGVLGEQFLAIDPGSSDKPVLAEGAILKGIDPPRLDLFLAKGYELLDTTMAGIRNNRELLGDIAVGSAGLLKNLNAALSENREHINHIIQNADTLSSEANALAHEVRVKYVNNPKVEQTIENLHKITNDVQRESGPLLKDAKEALANINRISATVGSVEDQVKLKKALGDMMQLATRANTMVTDAQSIVQHIKTGKGTVGALIMDEQVYDDVQEMVRDLKHNPWKFLWKE